MSKRPESVALFMRDLWAFLRFLKINRSTFCRQYRLNKNLFNDLIATRHTPTIETMDRLYGAMDEAGFVSLRACQESLILAALQHEPGENEELIAAAVNLKAYNKIYPECPDEQA